MTQAPTWKANRNSTRTHFGTVYYSKILQVCESCFQTIFYRTIIHYYSGGSQQSFLNKDLLLKTALSDHNQTWFDKASEKVVDSTNFRISVRCFSPSGCARLLGYIRLEWLSIVSRVVGVANNLSWGQLVVYRSLCV